MATQAEINALYQQILGRDADSGGSNFWASSGMSSADIASQLAASAEAQSRASAPAYSAPAAAPVQSYSAAPAVDNGPESTAYLRQMGLNQADANQLYLAYYNELGRIPDASGAQYYAGLINNGTPIGDIISSLNKSDEGLAWDPTGGEYVQGGANGAAATGAQYMDWGNVGGGLTTYAGATGGTGGAGGSTTTPNKINNTGESTVGSYREASPYKQMTAGDYDALQKAIYEGSTAGLKQQEQAWRDQSNQGLANRGVWSSGIAERAQNDITDKLADAYTQAGSNAATTRYGMQQQDLQGLNSYNQNTANAYNNYQLGYGGYTNALQQINDSYALNRAQLLNNAAANQSNAYWGSQWAPFQTLAGVWNGTAGTLSSSNRDCN